MSLVRFLERKGVIRFFGVALILAPFLNYLLHITLLKYKAKVAWSQFQYLSVFKHTSGLSLFLAACSIAIGFTLLSGKLKAWRYVLLLLGTHILIQAFNVNNDAWKGPMAWPSFIFNACLFFFILDQLVWRVKAEGRTEPDQSAPVGVSLEVPAFSNPLPNPLGNSDELNELQNLSSAENSFAPPPPPPATPTVETLQSPIDLNQQRERHIINLKSYRKILFSFGDTRPWGELKTLSSEQLAVKCIVEPPQGIESKVVQINFSKEAVVDIQYDRREGEFIYFKPLNMDKEKVTNLNKWLIKIAV